MRPPDTTTNNESASQHWYTRIPPRPPRRRRYGSSVVNNVWNAWSNWDNAVQGNSAGLLATMRTQVTNLKQMIDTSALDAQQKPLVQRLIAETKQALDSINPALLSQRASRLSSIPAPMRRTASEQSIISSNAKAALGCMAYLQDGQLFPGCGGTYQYVRERLEQIFRLMDGEYQTTDVEGVRQQQGIAEGVTTPPSSPSGSGWGQNIADGAASGLQARVQPSTTNGAPGMPSSGLRDALGQDWYSQNSTTFALFLARVQSWAQSGGVGRDGLAKHLRENSIPETVVQQVIPYI